MVEASFPDELWYSNFRVTRGTFTYILHEIGDEISRQARSCNAESTTSNSFVLLGLDCRISHNWKLIWFISFLCCALALRKCARLLEIRKIQLVVYHQCCVMIG